MKRFTLFVCLSLVVATAAFAADASRDLRNYNIVDGRFGERSTGGVVSQGKAQVDTVYMMGGAGDITNLGRFETLGGAPSWMGWTPVDLSAPSSFWSVSDYNCANLDPTQLPFNKAWWCGKEWLDDCSSGDFFGYGNNWFTPLDFTGTVADPGVSTGVQITARMNFDNEPGFDYLYLMYEGGTSTPFTDYGILGVFNGAVSDTAVDISYTHTPAEYTGAGNNEITLRWLFQSDGAWSDEDCLWPTMGACQIDLINVFFDGGLVGTEEDCDDNPLQWEAVVDSVATVGNFGQVWPALQDIDPCRSNNTPVAAFIDDGQIVPGVGPTLCDTWCYGPNAWTHNWGGGATEDNNNKMQNEIWSPVLTWPGPQYDGGQILFDVYRHEALFDDPTSTGFFYVWHVRSVGPPFGPGQIGEFGWNDDNFVYFGGPDWIRTGFTVSDLLAQGRTHVQMALGINELGWFWGSDGENGTPAPYFDNATFLAYEFGGPAIGTREIDIANDDFPEITTIDYGNLAANHVRFDMARSIAPVADAWNDPGDTIMFDVVVVRSGAILNDRPKLVYKLFPNPLFDGLRTLSNEGWVYGDTTFTAAGAVVGDRWNFDMPDSNFLYPGDVMHYFIEAVDNIGGSLGVSTLPADTTGFSDKNEYPGYTRADNGASYVVHALPTLETLSPGDHPKILFWNDFANRGGENEWIYSLRALGYRRGVDYDYFYTNGPSSGVGDGLGGRATSVQLAGYETILYHVGDLSTTTWSNGDASQADPGDDVTAMDGWIRQGNKNMFLTGDDFVNDLTGSGPLALGFVGEFIGVSLTATDLRPLVGAQSAPYVKAIPGNSVFNNCPEWIAYGGCLGFNTFDAVEVTTAEKLAEFLDPDCNPAAYDYAAATRNINGTYNSDVIYMPYDFMFIYTGTCATTKNLPPTPYATRTCLLEEVMLAFGHVGGSPITDVPDAGGVFSVKNYPNPFNPVTKIEFNMPRKGELSIKIFNVRGELVRTLFNGVREAGQGFEIWDGTNERGGRAASGVYFYETRFEGQTKIGKMALVK